MNRDNIGSGRILLTAFEPFLVRGWITKRNVSKEVLKLIRVCKGKKFDYEVLPVNGSGETRFLKALKHYNPSGVISLGESGTQRGSIKIEPHANIAAASVLGELVPRFDLIAQSEFATELLREALAKMNSTIGYYYCNRIYLNAINWSGRNGYRPVIFIHVPVNGDYVYYMSQILEVAEKMRKEIAAPGSNGALSQLAQTIETIKKEYPKAEIKVLYKTKSAYHISWPEAKVSELYKIEARIKAMGAKVIRDSRAKDGPLWRIKLTKTV